MCRALMYLGNTLSLYDLLYKTDASLVKQAYDPRYMHGMQNLAGFGMATWSKQFSAAEKPMMFKSITLPFYDKNLENIAARIKGECILAHVRGLPYEGDQMGMRNVVSQQNLHPFIFEGTNVVLAHNGALTHLDELKTALIAEIKPQYFSQIKGSTDTEWLYALFLSRLPSLAPTLKEMIQAVFESFDILRTIRSDRGVYSFSPINLFITDGQRLVATRYVIDYGHYVPGVVDAHLDYHSLWYTLGEAYTQMHGHYEMRGYPLKSSIIVSSEPLTVNPSSWIKVPEYSLLAVERNGYTLDLQMFDIDL
jgi:glutamine amidotransferase